MFKQESVMPCLFRSVTQIEPRNGPLDFASVLDIFLSFLRIGETILL